MLHPVNHDQLVALWAEMAKVARRGGFWEVLMGKSSEYNRVKDFVNVLENPEKDYKWGREWLKSECMPGILPNFMGLNNQPFYDVADFDWIPQLESQAEALRAEGESLHKFFIPTYYGSEVQSGARWMQGHINAFGSQIPDQHFGELAPLKVNEVARSLPRFNGFSGYPFGHSLYSVMEPGVAVKLHTSADNLRVRCHLALDIPENCGIEVAGEVRQWQAGKVLLIDDSFPHQVWNKADRPRMVLILDFWHFDLTDAEIEGLTMLLSKKEIRKLLMPMRGTPRKVMDGLMELFSWEESQQQEMFTAWWPQDVGDVDYFDISQYRGKGKTRLTEV